MNAKEKRGMFFDRLAELLPEGLTLKTSDDLWLIDEKNKYIFDFFVRLSVDGTFLDSRVGYSSFFQDPEFNNNKIMAYYFDLDLTDLGIKNYTYCDIALPADNVCRIQIEEMIRPLWHSVIPMINNISSFDDYRCMDEYFRRKYPHHCAIRGNPVWDIAYAEGREKACEYLSERRVEKDEGLLNQLREMNDAELAEILRQREERMRKAYGKLINRIRAASGTAKNPGTDADRSCISAERGDQRDHRYRK